MESLGNFIIAVGWPALVIGSIWVWRNMDHLSHAAKTFLNISLASFYMLGFVCTVYWLEQPWYVGVFPAFVVFLVLFVITLRTTYLAEHQRYETHEDREAHI